MQALGLGGACLAAVVQCPVPWGTFTQYVFGEVAGFAGAPRIWVNGIVAKVGCMSKRQGGDLEVKYLYLESPR